jgi:uncharacterized damage-inducible protein DinB
MKSMNSARLLDTLQADVRQTILELTRLRQLPAATLQQQPAPGKWSVAQVLDHLNGYGTYYLPALEHSLQEAGPARENYKPGWLGNYFTKMMQPGADGVVAKKMKAPKGYRPDAAQDSMHNIGIATAQQQQLLQLLETARSKDIAQVRIPISISKLLTLKAGDTFRFLVAHQNRHFLQIRNTLRALGASLD